jgi:hypothetical protein
MTKRTHQTSPITCAEIEVVVQTCADQLTVMTMIV